MSLYSFNGQYPGPIPFRIRLSNGMTRTDPSTFTTWEIANAGYEEVDPAPIITSTQILSWSSELVDWVVRDKTAEELISEEIEKQNNLSNEITKHRDMLISQGFKFNDIMFDSRPEDQKRISGAALLAFIAISQGAPAGYYYWHGGSEPFTWIAQNNNTIEMDAYTVIEFGKAAAEHERAHIFAARALKDMIPMPEDYTNPIYWPNYSQADGSTIIDDGSSII